MTAWYLFTALCVAAAPYHCQVRILTKFTFPTAISCQDAIPEIESGYRRESAGGLNPAASWCSALNETALLSLPSQGGSASAPPVVAGSR